MRPGDAGHMADNRDPSTNNAASNVYRFWRCRTANGYSISVCTKQGTDCFTNTLFRSSEKYFCVEVWL